MDSFEVFLELIKFGAKFLPLSLDTGKALQRFGLGANCKLALHFFQLILLLAAERCQVVSCKA